MKFDTSMNEAGVNSIQIVRILKALADHKRLAMAQAIAEAGEMPCGELVKRFPIAQATVSHHMKVLVDSGIVSVRREGQYAYFSINGDIAEQARSAFSDFFRREKPGQRRSAARSVQP